METNTELLNRIEAHIKGRLAVAESSAASSELYEGKKIAYNSILGFIKGLRADCAAQAQLVPSDVQEAANQYIGYPPEVDECVSTSQRRRAFAAGMLAERERLMKEAEAVEGVVCGRVADHINIKVKGGDYLTPKGVMHILADKSKYEIGDKVKLIILK